MQFLKNLLHKNESMFLKGGKFERFYPLYEAGESFAFTPREVTKTNVHVRDSLDSKRMMSVVIIALIPAILFGAYNTGYQAALAAGEPTGDMFGLFVDGMITIMPIILVSYAVGGAWEGLFAVIRRHEINEGFLVTGILFPLTLPPTIPLWQVAVGISFGVVIGKEIFGGTGMNILNPALTARAFLYFSYPIQISGDKVWIATNPETMADGMSGATPLAVAAYTPVGGDAQAELAQFSDSMSQMSYSLWDMAVGLIPGSIGETSAIACLIGAFILIAQGVGNWRIMAGVLGGAVITAFGLNLLAGENILGMMSLQPHYHLVMGSLMFGAIFMATDPVSAARTTKGMWIYGLLIGFFTVLIRNWNPAYPEGVMLAILFMNIFAPLIDHYVVQGNVKRRMNRVAA